MTEDELEISDLLDGFKGRFVKINCVIGNRNFFYCGRMVSVGEEFIIINDRYSGKVILRRSNIISCEETKE